ncbi:hypothetical protein [Aeromonas hydrophila]|uniref:hypothetical protein n=1 Tax=Aeromonas hydrophila TaxID=644 RepID=UPI002B45D2D9|nr:hypothetical protein [Aeromonas hydrophila]
MILHPIIRTLTEDEQVALLKEFRRTLQVGNEPRSQSLFNSDVANLTAEMLSTNGVIDAYLDICDEGIRQVFERKVQRHPQMMKNEEDWVTIGIFEREMSVICSSQNLNDHHCEKIVALFKRISSSLPKASDIPWTSTKEFTESVQNATRYWCAMKSFIENKHVDGRHCKELLRSIFQQVALDNKEYSNNVDSHGEFAIVGCSSNLDLLKDLASSIASRAKELGLHEVISEFSKKIKQPPHPIPAAYQLCNDLANFERSSDFKLAGKTYALKVNTESSLAEAILTIEKLKSTGNDDGQLDALIDYLKGARPEDWKINRSLADISCKVIPESMDDSYLQKCSIKIQEMELLKALCADIENRRCLVSIIKEFSLAGGNNALHKYDLICNYIEGKHKDGPLQNQALMQSLATLMEDLTEYQYYLSDGYDFDDDYLEDDDAEVDDNAMDHEGNPSLINFDSISHLTRTCEETFRFLMEELNIEDPEQLADKVINVAQNNENMLGDLDFIMKKYTLGKTFISNYMIKNCSSPLLPFIISKSKITTREALELLDLADKKIISLIGCHNEKQAYKTNPSTDVKRLSDVKRELIYMILTGGIYPSLLTGKYVNEEEIASSFKHATNLNVIDEFDIGIFSKAGLNNILNKIGDEIKNNLDANPIINNAITSCILREKVDSLSSGIEISRPRKMVM